MNIKAYESFRRHYKRLPKKIQSKVEEKLKLLINDFRHPSLQGKKIKGASGIWEMRVDINYRLTFEIEGDTIFLRVVDNHDAALKNP